MSVMVCGLGGEAAEEHRKRALELCYGLTLGLEMVQVSRLFHAWNGNEAAGTLGLGWEGPGSRQAGLVRSQGFICLTLLNKWHPQPLFTYF